MLYRLRYCLAACEMCLCMVYGNWNSQNTSLNKKCSYKTSICHWKKDICKKVKLSVTAEHSEVKVTIIEEVWDLFSRTFTYIYGGMHL